MEITYKGYTVTPNSERQPDGRWLPVASLEIKALAEATSPRTIKQTIFRCLPDTLDPRGPKRK